MTYRAWNLKPLDRAALRELTQAIAEQATEELEYNAQDDEPWSEQKYAAALAAHGRFLILRLAGKVAVVQQVSRQPDGAENAGDDRTFLSRGQTEGVEIGRGHVRPLRGARALGEQRRRHGRPDGHGGDDKPYAHAATSASAMTMRKCRVMRLSHQFPSGVNDTPRSLMACSI